MRSRIMIALFVACLPVLSGFTASDITDLARLDSGKTFAQNALWIENPLTARFNNSKNVVVADVTGPAVITMIHFAMPQELKLNRDLLLKIYWDGETAPVSIVLWWIFSAIRPASREEMNTAIC